MIIDCHGHYTTAPKALEDWRNRQIGGLTNLAATPTVSELPPRSRSAPGLAAGVLGLDMYKMREALEKAGLKYID